MDAAPLLVRVAKLLQQYRLDAVLIGNAGAALQGASVTTVDFDFLFRKTPALFCGRTILSPGSIV
jgi:hypothetical protein